MSDFETQLTRVLNCIESELVSADIRRVYPQHDIGSILAATSEYADIVDILIAWLPRARVIKESVARALGHSWIGDKAAKACLAELKRVCSASSLEVLDIYNAQALTQAAARAASSREMWDEIVEVSRDLRIPDDARFWLLDGIVRRKPPHESLTELLRIELVRRSPIMHDVLKWIRQRKLVALCAEVRLLRDSGDVKLQRDVEKTLLKLTCSL